MVRKGHTFRKTADGELIGPKMHAAIGIVYHTGPYKSMNALAKRVGPNGSQQYGYRIVKRCLRKGMLELVDHPDATPQARGAVEITRKGTRYYREQLDADQ